MFCQFSWGTLECFCQFSWGTLECFCQFSWGTLECFCQFYEGILVLFSLHLSSSIIHQPSSFFHHSVPAFFLFPFGETLTSVPSVFLKIKYPNNELTFFVLHVFFQFTL